MAAPAFFLLALKTDAGIVVRPADARTNGSGRTEEDECLESGGGGGDITEEDKAEVLAAAVVACFFGLDNLSVRSLMLGF